MAAQFTVTNFFFDRGPWWWMASAQISLALPLSPVMNTVALLAAALTMML